MINLFKANIYRLFHAKVTYVILALILLVYLMAFGFMRIVNSSYDPENTNVSTESEDGNAAVTVTYADDFEPEEVNPYKMLVNYMSSGFVAILLGIFTAEYTDDERKSGFLKNLPKPARKKSNIFLSKVFIVAFYSILTTLVLSLTSFILAARYGNMMHFDMAQYIEYLLKQTLLYTAFGTALLAVYEIFRKGVIVIIFTIFASTMLPDCMSLFESLLVYKNIVSEKFIDLFGYSQYMISARSGLLTVGSDRAAHVSTWVVGLVSLVIYAIIGSLVYKKRDVL